MGTGNLASLTRCGAMQAFVDKFRYNAKRASLVQSRIKAIERMADIELVEADPEYCFRYPQISV